MIRLLEVYRLASGVFPFQSGYSFKIPCSACFFIVPARLNLTKVPKAEIIRVGRAEWQP